MPDAPTGPWLSIITVVKDDPQGFARTAESIAGQNVTGVEWVVIDGSANAAVIPGILAVALTYLSLPIVFVVGGVMALIMAGLSRFLPRGL